MGSVIFIVYNLTANAFDASLVHATLDMFAGVDTVTRFTTVVVQLISKLTFFVAIEGFTLEH